MSPPVQLTHKQKSQMHPQILRKDITLLCELIKLPNKVQGSVIDSKCDSALALDLSPLILKVKVKGSFISLKPTHEKV